MKRSGNQMSLPVKIGIGFVAGAVLGFIINSAGLNVAWVKPFGDLFIRLVRLIVVPLVFCALVSGAAGMGDAHKMGRIATKTLIYFFLTTGVAATIGLLLANIFDPGMGITLSTEGLKAKVVTRPGVVDTLLNIVPMNPVAAFAEGKMLQVIFFSILFGFGLSRIGAKGEQLLRVFQQGTEVMIQIIDLVMKYAPYGVAALIAYTLGQHGLGVILPLIKVVVLLYAMALLHICIVYLPVVRFGAGIPIKRFLSQMAEPLLVAASTTSSAAALAPNLRATERLGVPRSISSFVIPLGNTINMDGGALWMSLCAVFVAQVYGLDLSLNQQVSIVLAAVLGSIGSVGVAGFGLVVLFLVFQIAGLPMEGVALLAGIDRITDMGRTATNVMGDATASVLMAKLEGELAMPAADAAAADAPQAAAHLAG